MPTTTEYTADYFLNLYDQNIPEKDKEEEEEKVKETFNADYFLNKYDSLEDDLTEQEISESKKQNIQQQRIETQEQLQDEDVDLKEYVGNKEVVLEQEPVQYDANYFLNLYDAEPSKELQSGKQPTVAQKIELGARLERHTLGNLWRTAQAGLATISNNKTFEENIKEIETERTENIFNAMQKQYGIDFKEYKDDASVITGRIGSAFADPVTFFIPWAKIAKLGKLGATTVGGTIGAADMALYEYAAYGEVNPNNVLFGAATGGASSLLGKVIANRSRSVSTDELNIGKVDNPVRDTVVKSSVKDEPIINLTAKEIDDLDQVTKIIQEKNIPLLKELETGVYIEKLYKKANNDIRAFNNIKNKQAAYNKSTRQWEALPDATMTQRQINNLNTKRKEAEDFLSVGYFDLIKKDAFGRVKVVDDTLKTLAARDEFKLTDSILQKVLYETARPLFGAGVGFTAGTFIGDDEDAINYSLMGAGLTFGLLYNRVKDAPYLLKGQKEKAFGLIENESARMLHNYLKTKGSSVIATRGVNHGSENEILSRYLFHQFDGRHKNIIGAEEASDFLTGLWGKRISEVVQNATEVERVAATRILKQLATRTEVKKQGNFSTEQMRNIDNLIANTKVFKNEFNTGYVKPIVTFKEIDNYDLPQLWSVSKIYGNKDQARTIVEEALAAEFPKWNKKAKELTGGSNSLKEAASAIISRELGENIESTFKGSNLMIGRLGTFDGIPQLKNYQKERIFKSLEARKILEPLLEDDLKVILDKWVTNTTKGVEFARKFGENGQVLGKLERSLRSKFEQGLLTEKEFRTKLKLMHDTVNAFFGLYGKAAKDPLQSNLAKDGFALLTFLSNSTMLPRSLIPQLGDFLQPFQNSNVWSAARGFANAWKKDGVARIYGVGGGRENTIGGTFTKDIEGVFSAGLHPSTSFQEKLSNWTKFFFKYNGMAPATDLGVRVAFSAGIDEIFNVAKEIGTKTTISKALNNRLQYYGLNRSDIKELYKFKTVEEALDSPVAESILIKAGNKAMKRDVGLPQIGNRMFFAQSNNPLIKSMGLFLSWAQYKVAQMNGLITRVEDGDLKLAIKMLGTITIFGGLRELQIEMSPAREYYEENEPRNFSKKWWGESSALAGFADWRVEKFTRIASSWDGSGHGTATSSITPLVGYLDRWYNSIGKTWRNLDAGDYEGAAVSSIKAVPLGAEIIDYTNRLSEVLTEETLLEDKANRKSKQPSPVYGFATGGIVTGPEVPFTKENPADRVDPFTGEPYQEQMDRLGFGNEQGTL